jgi:hypothetical protein
MSAGRLVHDQNLEVHEIGYINTLGPKPPFDRFGSQPNIDRSRLPQLSTLGRLAVRWSLS